MRFSTLAAVAFTAAASVPQVLAGIFTTSPVATTSCAAGSNCIVSWIDDGKAPNLTAVGLTHIYLSVGSVTQQTNLMEISAPGVDVSKVSSANFTVPATLGPNSNVYFIRYESAALKDANNSAIPYLAFSAKFTLTGMTGTFNATEQSQINAATASSVPVTTAIKPSTSSSSVPATKAAAATTSSHATSATGTGTGAAHPTTTANGAAKLAGVGATAGFLAALISLAL